MKVQTINRVPFLSSELEPKVAREMQVLRDEVAFALDSHERVALYDSFPTPGPEWRCVRIVVPVPNGPDQEFVCLKNSDGSYGWQASATGF